MKIDVTVGEVPIREVVARRHLENVLSIWIATPLDRHPLVAFGSLLHSRHSRSYPTYLVDLYHARREGEQNYSPSRVCLTAETPSEADALDAGLFEVDWQRYMVTLVALPAAVLDAGQVVQSWTYFQPGSAEYLESPR